MMYSFFSAAVDPSLGCNGLVENVRSAPFTVDFAIDLTTINVHSEVALPPYGAYAYQYMFNSQQVPLFTTPRGLRSDIFYYATKKYGLEAAESRNPAPSRAVPGVRRLSGRQVWEIKRSRARIHTSRMPRIFILCTQTLRLCTQTLRRPLALNPCAQALRSR